MRLLSPVFGFGKHSYGGDDTDVSAEALKINPAYFLFPRPLFRGNSDVDQLGKIFE